MRKTGTFARVLELFYTIKCELSEVVCRAEGGKTCLR